MINYDIIFIGTSPVSLIKAAELSKTYSKNVKIAFTKNFTKNFELLS